MSTWIISLNLDEQQLPQGRRRSFFEILSTVGARVFEKSWSAAAFECDAKALDTLRRETGEFAVITRYNDLRHATRSR